MQVSCRLHDDEEEGGAVTESVIEVRQVNYVVG